MVSGGGATKTGCSHSGFRFPKHSDVKISQWTLKNIHWVKIKPCEDWSHICPFQKHACGVGLGLKNAQLVDCHSSFGSGFTSPIRPNFQWRSNCTPKATIGPSFCRRRRRNYEMVPPCARSKFSRDADQFLFGGKAVITRGWILRKPILYSWMPSPSTACWRPVRGRMSENRTFSGSHARQQVVYEGEKLQSVWPGKARRRSTTSGHICDKCSQAFKWVR